MERNFQSWLLNEYRNLGGWAEGRHPALGSGAGLPDVEFLYNGRLMPVELKIGQIFGLAKK